MSQSPFKITRYGIIGNLTGSVQGTASCALTASYVSGAVMSSTVQFIEQITSASYSAIVPDPKTLYVITDGTASVETASYSVHSDTASLAVTASYALSSSKAVSASYSSQAGSTRTAEQITIESKSVGSTYTGEYPLVACPTTNIMWDQDIGSNEALTWQRLEYVGRVTFKPSNNQLRVNGSISASGAVTASVFKGNLIGTATSASRATSASMADSASQAETASYVSGLDTIFLPGTGSAIMGTVFVYGVGGFDGTNPQPGVNDLASVLSSIESRLA